MIRMVKKFNDTILRAYRGEKTNYTPTWFMRQAGRSQKEYREIKKKYSLFEITHRPDLCAYVTRLPVEQYDIDAAILYKDIMTPLPAMGIAVRSEERRVGKEGRCWDGWGVCVCDV